MALKDFPRWGVKIGDIGYVVQNHSNPEGVSVEFVDESGRILGFVISENKFFSEITDATVATTSSQTSTTIVQLEIR